jgi:hypothetical protein
MKSGKQRRAEIKHRRLERARAFANLDRRVLPAVLPVGAVPADALALAHNNTYGLLPLFYLDRPFVCRDCGAAEVWTAKQQKWWYETAQGNIDSIAIRCRSCRAIERRRVEAAREASAAGMKKKREAQGAKES